MSSLHANPFTRIVVAALFLAALPAVAASRPKVAFLGLHPEAGMDPSLVRSVSEYTQTELAALAAYDVIGMGDIDSLLGLERTKQLLGCDEDTSCIADVGGALGVDRALTGNLARLGDTVLVNLSLLDVTRSRVVARVGRRINAQGSLEPVLDAIRPALEELAAADGRSVSRPLEVLVVGRGDFDVLGGGGALGATVVVQGSVLGVQATLVGPVPSTPPVGLRLDGRLAPWLLGAARPFVVVGAAIFPDTAAVRAGGGVELRFGRLRALVDLGFEHYLKADITDALLVGAGLGAAF